MLVREWHIKAVAKKSTKEYSYSDNLICASRNYTPRLPTLEIKVPGSANPKILVVGAGAIGCFVGAKLVQIGCDLSFYARAQTAQALRVGLQISDFEAPEFALAAEHYQVIEPADALPEFDLVILTVKATQTQELALILQKMSPHTPVWSLQNGVDNVAVLSSAGLAVVPGMVPFNITQLDAQSNGPLRFHRGTAGLLAFETPKNPVTALLFKQLQSLGAMLAEHADLPPVQWAKLLINLNNPVNALSNLPLVIQLSDPGYRACLALLQSEALALFKLADIKPGQILPIPIAWLPRILRLPTPIYKIAARRMLKMDANARSSMWEDFKRNRMPEIDALCGAVVRLAAAHGGKAPANQALLSAINAGLRHASSKELWRILSESPR